MLQIIDYLKENKNNQKLKRIEGPVPSNPTTEQGKGISQYLHSSNWNITCNEPKC